MLRCQSLDRSRKSVRYEVIGKSVGGAVHPRLFLENSMDSMEIELTRRTNQNLNQATFGWLFFTQNF